MIDFIPQKGDIVYTNLSPAIGHEQKGRRPVLVVSSEYFNLTTGFCMICPITKHQKNFPFEVKLDSKNIFGVVLTNQMRTIDYKTRKIKKHDKVSDDCIKNVIRKINLIFD